MQLFLFQTLEQMILFKTMPFQKGLLTSSEESRLPCFDKNGLAAKKIYLYNVNVYILSAIKNATCNFYKFY